MPLTASGAVAAQDTTIHRLELRLLLERAGDERTVGMLLAVLAGMTADEVARYMGASAAAVRKQVRRTVQRLARRAADEFERVDVRFSRQTRRGERCGSGASI